MAVLVKVLKTAATEEISVCVVAHGSCLQEPHVGNRGCVARCSINSMSPVWGFDSSEFGWLWSVLGTGD